MPPCRSNTPCRQCRAHPPVAGRYQACDLAALPPQRGFRSGAVPRHGLAWQPVLCAAAPGAPLSVAELDHCKRTALPEWRRRQQAATVRVSPDAGVSPVALLTNMTDVPVGAQSWNLGVTAAHGGLPLVLVGAGRRWSGLHDKLRGVARAAQLLAAEGPLDRSAVLVYADGTDTAVATGTPAAARAVSLRLEAHVRERGGALLSGECKSWPLCYSANYSRDARHAACHRRFGAAGQCFVNSGINAADPEELLRLFRL